MKRFIAQIRGTRAAFTLMEVNLAIFIMAVGVLAMTALYPDVVAHFKGTPFKMRFLTASGVPFGAKIVSLAYFALFFGVFATAGSPISTSAGTTRSSS